MFPTIAKTAKPEGTDFVSRWSWHWQHEDERGSIGDGGLTSDESKESIGCGGDERGFVDVLPWLGVGAHGYGGPESGRQAEQALTES